MDIFLFGTATRSVLGPTWPPIQWVSVALSLGIKRTVRETDYSLPSSAEVKNTRNYTSPLPYDFMAWLLPKHSVRLYDVMLS